MMVSHSVGEYQPQPEAGRRCGSFAPDSVARSHGSKNSNQQACPKNISKLYSLFAFGSVWLVFFLLVFFSYIHYFLGGWVIIGDCISWCAVSPSRLPDRFVAS